MKKRLFLFSLILTFFMTFNFLFASTDSVVMEVLKDQNLKINITDNSYFEKKLISKDLANKELTFELKITNNEPTPTLSGEIMLVIDTSNSMANYVDDYNSRKDVVLNSAKTLVSSLLENNNDLKIGIVTFASNQNILYEGTIKDANLISTPNNDTQALINYLDNIEESGPRTNLQAGISLAKQQFSSNVTNKYIIILTDGVPNLSLDFDYEYYSQAVIENTKNEIKSLKDKNIKTFAMLTGIENEDAYPISSDKTFKEIIDEIFDSEYLSSFYYIKDEDIEDTITQKIYDDLKPQEKVLKNISFTDTFSKEVVDNFIFNYDEKLNFGDISPEIDSTNSIIWNISELSHGQTAIVRYTIKLKEDFNTDIIDKNININENGNLIYTDFMNNSIEENSNSSVEIKLTEPPVTSDILNIFTILIFIISIFGIMYLFNKKINLIHK